MAVSSYFDFPGVVTINSNQLMSPSPLHPPPQGPRSGYTLLIIVKGSGVTQWSGIVNLRFLCYIIYGLSGTLTPYSYAFRNATCMWNKRYGSNIRQQTKLTDRNPQSSRSLRCHSFDKRISFVSSHSFIHSTALDASPSVRK